MNKTKAMQTVKTVYEFYKGKPPIDVLTRELNTTPDIAKELLDEFKESIGKPKVVRKKAPPKKRGFDIHELPIPAVKVLAGIVAIAAIIRSVGYVAGYFGRIDIAFFAWLMAGLIAMISFVAPQILIIAWRRKQWFLVVLSSITLAVFMGTNIYITTQELDHARKIRENAELVNAEVVITAKAEIGRKEAKRIELLEDKERNAKDRDALQEQLITLKEGTPEYNTARTRLDNARKRYESSVSSIDSIDKELEALYDTPGLNVVEVKTKEEKELDRAMDLVYSVAIEIAGPFFLSCVLFL